MRQRARKDIMVKGTVSRDFLLQVFFHESPSPKPLKIMLGSSRIFLKIHRDIHKSRCTTSIIDTSRKFATGVNDTGGKFAAGCHRYQRHRRQICHRGKKLKMAVMVYSGAWGKLIDEKNQKSKIS